jgi:hypothetical protein
MNLFTSSLKNCVELSVMREIARGDRISYLSDTLKPH